MSSLVCSPECVARRRRDCFLGSKTKTASTSYTSGGVDELLEPLLNHSQVKMSQTIHILKHILAVKLIIVFLDPQWALGGQCRQCHNSRLCLIHQEVSMSYRSAPLTAVQFACRLYWSTFRTSFHCSKHESVVVSNVSRFWSLLAGLLVLVFLLSAGNHEEGQEDCKWNGEIVLWQHFHPWILLLDLTWFNIILNYNVT